VWFDALTNYISTLDWPDGGNFKKYWENGTTLQMAGKDQLRFQSLIWQAMLKSANVKATDSVFYHGFITSGGTKMSKSLGNVINPYDLVKKYGTDATRYLLLRHVNPTDDSDVTWERLDEWYTADLTNGLGNLVARVMKLAESHLDDGIETDEKSTPVEQFAFNLALDAIWSRIQKADQTITETKPFEVVKSEPEKGKTMLDALRRELLSIGHALTPYMPATSAKILEAAKANSKPENLFPRLA
jgi:methionyl-tRNA synthetase